MSLGWLLKSVLCQFWAGAVGTAGPENESSLRPVCHQTQHEALPCSSSSVASAHHAQSDEKATLGECAQTNVSLIFTEAEALHYPRATTK